MEKSGDEDKVKGLDTEDFADFEPAVMPIAPDGGIAPGAYLVDTSPLRDFETESVCAKGPCRHYWRLVVPMDTAQPDTYRELGIPEPRQTWRSCLLHPGTETQLSGDMPVQECNRWDPVPSVELLARRGRRDLLNNMQEKKHEFAGDEGGSEVAPPTGGEDASRQHDEDSR